MKTARIVVYAKKAGITALLSGLMLSASAAFGPSAHADVWELFDKGEHLLLPEGPIVQKGEILVPLRPIAERFGYSFQKITSTDTVITDSTGDSFAIKPGQSKVLKNGADEIKLDLAPRYINGSLFIPLSLAGSISGSGYTLGPGSHVIQLTPAEGDAVEALNSHYWYSFRQSAKSVIVDSKGGEMLTSAYTDLPDFGHEELIPVHQLNTGIGYLNREGKLAFKAEHYRLENFSEGMAAFKDLVPVKDGGRTIKMGFLNRTGKIVIPAKYDRVYDFSDGLAKVVSGGKTYYIDHNGKTAIPTIAGTQNSRPFSDGLAAVSVLVKSGGQTTAKTGFIDTLGKWSLKPVYDWAGSFSEGVAVATLNGKQGLIDKTGKWIVKPQKMIAGGFSGQFRNGYILFSEKKGSAYQMSLYDAQGIKHTIPGVDSIGDFSEGLISFREKDLTGYKNLSGETVIKPQFSWAGAFENGVARAEINHSDNTYSSLLIDKTGKIIWRNDGKPLE